MRYSLVITRDWQSALLDLRLASSKGIFAPTSNKSVPLKSRLELRRYFEDESYDVLFSCHCLENLFCCIPCGLYFLNIRRSSKFNSLKLYLENVPLRSGIMFHVGNFASDSKGCFLLGYKSSSSLEEPSSLIHSTSALNDFEKIVFPLVKTGELTHVRVFDTPNQFN